MSEYKSTLLVQDNSAKEIQKDDLDLLKKINEMSDKINVLERQIVPIGFVYTQYPGQPTPDELYKTTDAWENISSQYAGDFFRAEGGLAGAFNSSRQDYEWKSFWMTDTVQNGNNYSHIDVYMGKSLISYVGNLFTGSWNAPAAAIGTKWDTSEIRPSNYTVRIWKRIK